MATGNEKVTEATVEEVKGTSEAPRPNLSNEDQIALLNMVKEYREKESTTTSNSSDSTADIIKAVFAEVNKGTNVVDAHDEYAFMKEDSLDLADALPPEKWSTFVAHKTGYVIVDALINRRPVKAPLGMIEFKYQATKQIKQGNETEIFNFCTYECKSVKEREWLRAHPLFRTMFFDSIQEASSVDARKAAKLARIMTNMSSYGQADLMRMAKAHDLAMLENPQEMRASIASKLADDETKQEDSANIVRLQEQKMQEEVLAKTE